jgi:hypothetical protein
MLGDKYATLIELKARLNINDTADDTKLNNALDSATAGIELMCGRQFNDSGGLTTRKFRPDSAYVTSIDDISTNAGLVVVVNDATWQEGIMFELDPLNGVVGGQAGWPYSRIHAIQGSTFYPTWPGKANVVVTARWGWATVPSAIHDATLIAAEEISKLPSLPFGIGGYGDFGIVKARENPFVQRMVQPYIRYPFLAA